ncbi:MAG: zinc-ribbon domain-containing protein [Anaerolineae bacterium]
MSSTPESCQNCGASLPPDSRFCDSCGAPVQKQQTAPETLAYQTPPPAYQAPQQGYQQPYQQSYVPPEPPKKDRKTLYIILAVVAVLILLGCGACACFAFISNNSDSGYYNYGSQVLPQALGAAASLFV